MVGGPGRPDDGRQVSTVNRLPLKQQADDPVKGFTMPAEQLGGRVFGIPEQPSWVVPPQMPSGSTSQSVTGVWSSSAVRS
jgi:hypothetical protein